jgi:hypothetical protein
MVRTLTGSHQQGAPSGQLIVGETTVVDEPAHLRVQAMEPRLQGLGDAQGVSQAHGVRERRAVRLMRPASEWLLWPPDFREDLVGPLQDCGADRALVPAGLSHAPAGAAARAMSAAASRGRAARCPLLTVSPCHLRLASPILFSPHPDRQKRAAPRSWPQQRRRAWPDSQPPPVYSLRAGSSRCSTERAAQRCASKILLATACSQPSMSP